MTQALTAIASGRQRVREWFASLGRTPFPFQEAAWEAYVLGQSGLIHAPTGNGKTLAAALGPMIEAIDAGAEKQPPLTLLWITPLRALASDTAASLHTAVDGLNLPWKVELRTSDTTAAARKRQKTRLPTVLVTTPESLSLLISYPDARERFAHLRCIVADEWHELMGNKRGVQAQLAMAHLKAIQPAMRVWGLSATIGNMDDAVATLVGPAGAATAVRIDAPDYKQIDLHSLLPERIERFPWTGHLGTRMTEPVARAIESAGSTLLFTNTRSQSELWFRALLTARPEWVGEMAIHHGSIDRKLRQTVESMLREGKLRAVVCTSSLDLGVDFWPVDQVIQIGGPKGIARIMQRAGRSGHRPGEASRIVCVPTQAMELIEYSAARLGIQQRATESREPIVLPLDVLAQHVVTVAAGDGFVESELLAEVRRTHAFEAITDEQWGWVMDFAQRGGPSLTAYPHFARVRLEGNRWVTASDATARMHRMSIGTITSDGAVSVQFVTGRHLGSVEESFAAKLKAGDTFTFAGRTVQFVRLHDMTIQVRLATTKRGTVPRWMGGKLPMSASLAKALRVRLDEAAGGQFVDAEMQHVRPILELQARWSQLPRMSEVLIETTRTRDGHHHFLYTMQGRLAHEGLAALLTYRLGEGRPITATFNDLGIELLSPVPLAETAEQWRAALSAERLLEDVMACLNTGELAKRHFREIARIAGLLVPQRPGAHRSVRQLQASSGLFYDVFSEFDPQNLLLEQARREVLQQQLEFTRLSGALRDLGDRSLILSSPARLTPLAFPLWAERIQSQQLRSESASARIERVARQLEAAADADGG
ncbi:MAG TPA: ligase-associated DNA damage response DEXH box helicase [Tepidisphaeraceae bacterium]|jgi:ATP-dependent Lhr-like helicase|nr:ligase-associated DNA damage response DEXH box helicase [Tepidisphaeraceae bacterium]